MVKQTFPLLEVRGSAFEMGHQHGEQAADLIRRYLLLIERITGKPRATLCENAMRFLPELETFYPLFTAEVRGLAEGARITLAEAMLCQVRAEASHPWAEGCTAFALRGAATADGLALVGQNQDLPPEFGEVSILLRVQPNDGRPRALIYTFAGQLGYFGMNEHGVCNYANAVYDCPWQPGMSHYPLKRLMLEKASVRECVEVYQEVKVCSAVNIVLGDGAGNIGDIECRTEGIALYQGDHPDAIVHTNHYLTPAFRPLEKRSLPDSFTRYQRMSTWVREHWGKISVAGLQEVMADHAGEPASICRHGAREMHTTSGHIAEPQKGLLHIRRGHGCLGSWETYRV